MQMKLNSTHEELKAYVQAQMRAMDCAIKECQPGSHISAALEEIAACNKLVFFCSGRFPYRGGGQRLGRGQARLCAGRTRKTREADLIVGRLTAA
jgi:hypothetical protein